MTSNYFISRTDSIIAEDLIAQTTQLLRILYEKAQTRKSVNRLVSLTNAFGRLK